MSQGTIEAVVKLTVLFDVGWEIPDMESVRRVVRLKINQESAELVFFTSEENMLGFISIDELPIFLQLKLPLTISFGEFKVIEKVSLSIHQQGVIRVELTIPFKGDLNQLAVLSAEVSSSDVLLVEAKKMVTEIFGLISEYIVDPSVSKDFEDYLTFEFLRTNALDLESLLNNEKTVLAQIIRGERQEFVEEEVNEALSARVFPAKNQLAIIGWSGTLLFGADVSEASFVIQLVNIWLLELKQFNRRLEKVTAEIDRNRLIRIPLIATLRGFASSPISELLMDWSVMSLRNESDVVRDQYLWRVSARAVEVFGIVATSEKVRDYLDKMTQIEETDSSRRREFAQLIIGAVLGAILTAVATLLAG